MSDDHGTGAPMKPGIGKPVRRKEDLPLLTGRGRYSDDLNLDGQLYGVVLRCPYPHARLVSIDTSRALAAPGVHAVLTGADYRADKLAPLPSLGNPPDLPLINVDGSPIITPPDWPLIVDKCRRVGEGVAFVIADKRSHAYDAAERVDVVYDPLQSVTDARAALKPGAPVVWDEVAANLLVNADRGDRAGTEAAFARADHVVTIEVYNNRVNGVPMEPRAALGEFDLASGKYTLHYGGQGATLQQDALAKALCCETDKVRAICRDVGGHYGVRSIHCREHVLVTWAARRLGRPIKWTSDRSESFLIDTYGRDLWTHAELALDRNGRFLAFRSLVVANIGSQVINLVPLSRQTAVATGLYDIPHAHVHMKGAMCNVIPISTYRGAGRPEGIYTIERLIDKAAQELRFDPIELRRRNLIPVTKLPYKNPTGTLYDSGEFLANMEAAMEIADWTGFARRQSESTAGGKLRGIGLGNYVETATGIPFERVVLAVRPEGRIDLVIGTQASGQGHETSFSQVIADMLGVDFDCIDVRTGDTDFVKMGGGSNSSRSMRVGTLLLDRASKEIVAKGTKIAAHVLGVGESAVDFRDGSFGAAATNRRLNLFEIAAFAAQGNSPAELRGNLEATSEIRQMLPTFPNGCHICEVEIDPETGFVEIVRYAAVDDVGRVINPLLVDGQTQGATVQGIGQALMENCVHDPETGQMLTGTFMDYALPRAADVPFFKLRNNEVPAPNNPLGIKGAGEGGTTGAPPAVVNAIVNALASTDISHIDMPVTPEKIWRALKERA